MSTVVEGLITQPLLQRGIQCHADLSRQSLTEIPEFKHPYPTRACHPLTAQLNEEVHEWLRSYGVDEDMGQESWSRFVKHETPALGGYSYVGLDIEPRELLWAMKLFGWGFAVDMKLECATNIDQACKEGLDAALVLLWHYPDDQRFLDFVKSLAEAVSSQHGKSALEDFDRTVALARNKTKSIHELELLPLGSALRDLWVEYYADMPLGVAKRFAYFTLDFVAGCMEELRLQRPGNKILTMAEYITLRRRVGGVIPCVVFVDMIIARKIKRKSGPEPLQHIPDYLFWSGSMQGLLDAAADVIGWHNDLFSCYKECVVAKETNNLVYLVTRDSKCGSFYKGGEMVCEIIWKRIEEMERCYKQVRALSPPEYRPAVDILMEACRGYTSGTQEWHSRSVRYSLGVQPSHSEISDQTMS